MRRLLVLLCALLVTVALSSSNLFAAQRSLELRFQSILSIVCPSLFPVTGIVFVPEQLIEVDVNTDGRVGGDADDYANGKIKPGPDDQKSNGGKVYGIPSGLGGSTPVLKSQAD